MQDLQCWFTLKDLSSQRNPSKDMTQLKSTKIRKYNVKLSDFNSNRWQCFCSQQFKCEIGLKNHIKRMHKEYSDLMFDQMKQKCIQYSHPKYGFRIKKIVQKYIANVDEQNVKHKGIQQELKKEELIQRRMIFSQQLQKQQQLQKKHRIRQNHKKKMFVMDKKGMRWQCFCGNQYMRPNGLSNHIQQHHPHFRSVFEGQITRVLVLTTDKDYGYPVKKMDESLLLQKRKKVQVQKHKNRPQPAEQLQSADSQQELRYKRKVKKLQQTTKLAQLLQNIIEYYQQILFLSGIRQSSIK